MYLLLCCCVCPLLTVTSATMKVVTKNDPQGSMGTGLLHSEWVQTSPIDIPAGNGRTTRALLSAELTLERARQARQAADKLQPSQTKSGRSPAGQPQNQPPFLEDYHWWYHPGANCTCNNCPLRGSSNPHTLPTAIRCTSSIDYCKKQCRAMDGACFSILRFLTAH